jgi:SAM-dependent MidA family methyltransferase
MNSHEAENLFKLTPLEHDLTQRLQQVIQSEIAACNGVISFSRYMELALYYPGLGYYSNPLFKFGEQGDFVTSPLISNLFGQLLARQLSELFSFGVKPQILEFGAGNGKLAADILQALGEKIEHYYILELSADLVQWQAETIRQQVPQFMAKVVWLTGLPEQFEGVMLANEVLDAQPCNLVAFDNGAITGVGVTHDATGFHYTNYPLDSESLALAQELDLPYADYLTEVNLASRGFMRSLATSLKHGAILLIDYGYGESEYYHPEKTRGTLRGFYRQHVLNDVLQYPGLIDITTSVNWTSIVTTSTSNDLDFIGYTNQAGFLFNCGLAAAMLNLQAELQNNEYLAVSNQINKLISPTEMGESFKVCGFSKGLEQDNWLGFTDYDKSYSL